MGLNIELEGLDSVRIDNPTSRDQLPTSTLMALSGKGDDGVSKCGIEGILSRTD